jgi:hypothetical protein
LLKINTIIEHTPLQFRRGMFAAKSCNATRAPTKCCMPCAMFSPMSSAPSSVKGLPPEELVFRTRSSEPCSQKLIIRLYGSFPDVTTYISRSSILYHAMLGFEASQPYMQNCELDCEATQTTVETMSHIWGQESFNLKAQISARLASLRPY